MTSDLDLLRQFARENTQDAFAEIVRRHLDLVFSAALRQVRSPQLAEEVSQSVFADLARNAGKIGGTGVPPVSSLTPWLYTVTRRTAIDLIRKESRRQLREQIAVEMNNMNATESGTGVPPVWFEIEPLLDDAMAALDETDRSAILLRYFESKSLREVGEALGASEDAAQKRVSRAVERLREFFSKRNVTIGASGLAVLISANAVQSAPVGLAVTISTAAVLAGTAISTSTAIAATKVIAMTTLQKTIVTATVAVMAGAGIYEARQAGQLRNQVQTLQQQQAPLVEQLRQLQRGRDDATNRLAGLLGENAQLKSNSNENELLKLRGEIGTLRSQLDDYKEKLQAFSLENSSSHPTNLSEQELYNQRHEAMKNAFISLAFAAENFTRQNNGQIATNIDQLSSHLGWVSLNAPGGDIGLDSLEIVNSTQDGRSRILFRESTPHKNPNGRWERYYGSADGKIFDVESDDGDFEAWEQQHNILPPATN